MSMTDLNKITDINELAPHFQLSCWLMDLAMRCFSELQKESDLDLRTIKLRKAFRFQKLSYVVGRLPTKGLIFFDGEEHGRLSSEKESI